MTNACTIDIVFGCKRILAEIIPLARVYKPRFEALAKRATDQKLEGVHTAVARDIDSETVDPAGETARAVQKDFDAICGK